MKPSPDESQTEIEVADPSTDGRANRDAERSKSLEIELLGRLRRLQGVGMMALLAGAALVLSKAPPVQIAGAVCGIAGIVLTVLAFRVFLQIRKLPQSNG